jgi:hypothetical protein
VLIAKVGVEDAAPAVFPAVTVTSRVAVAFEHPPEPVTVYVIVAVPAATPVITPVPETTVAIAVFDDDQLPPATVELKVVVPATQIPCVPLKVPAFGEAVTVIVPVALTLPLPPVNGIV